MDGSAVAAAHFEEAAQSAHWEFTAVGAAAASAKQHACHMNEYHLLSLGTILGILEVLLETETINLTVLNF